jgi:hypothetical protein
MDFKQKYNKYKQKYLNLLKSTKGGAAGQPNSLLKVYLHRSYRYTPNRENIDEDFYRQRVGHGGVVDVRKYILDIDSKSSKKLIELRKNYESKIISNEEYFREKQIHFNAFTWNNFDLWETVFMNSNPSFDLIRDKNPRKHHILSKDKTYQLFNDEFRFFNQVLIPFVNRHYNKSLNNLDTWLNCDADMLGEIKADLNNCYGIRRTIPDDSEIMVIGDIHSSFVSLMHIFNDLISKGTYFVDRTLKLQENKYLIFTGDIIDYGPYSLECLWFVFTLLYHNPKNVIILKGNHENNSQYTSLQNGLYFSKQLEQQLEVEDVKDLIKNTLGLLPIVIFINLKGETYQFNHGSIDFDIAGFDDRTQRFTTEDSTIYKFINDPDVNIDKIFINLSLEGQLNTYQWGDFYYNPDTPSIESDRKIQDLKRRYGADYLKYLKAKPYVARPIHHFSLVEDYLIKNNIKSIISGHQDNVALGILPTNPTTREIDIGNNEKLNYDRSDGLIVTAFERDDKLTRDEYEIVLNPGLDMYAVTLSTAVHSKYVNYATYAILG